MDKKVFAEWIGDRHTKVVNSTTAGSAILESLARLEKALAEADDAIREVRRAAAKLDAYNKAAKLYEDKG